MDAAWIQVFVLTLSECVAPAGKTVCQEHEIELQFLSKSECEVALEQLVSAKEQLTNVIVNRHRSGCAISARKNAVFATLEEAKGAARDGNAWREPDAVESQPPPTRQAHEERLAGLPTCEESLGIAPCKLGDIIVEGATAGRPVEVWRSAN